MSNIEHEKNPNTKFKIYLKDDYDNFFDEIKLIPSDLPPHEIMTILKEKFNFPLIFAQELSKKTIDALSLYRARVLQQHEKIDESNVAEFSYPPKKLCKMQRCNRDAHQVFYASADEHTPFIELKKNIIPKKSIVYLSNWSIKNRHEPILMQNLFYGLPDDEEDAVSIFASSTNTGVRKLFRNLPPEAVDSMIHYLTKYQELFTAPSDHYYISSSIIYDIFENLNTKKISNKEDRLVNMPIVAYPSVAKNKKAINFVLKKEFVDEYLYLKSVYKVVVDEISDEFVSHFPLSKGVYIDGKVIWADLGIEYHGNICNWALLFEDNETNIEAYKIDIDKKVFSSSNSEDISIYQILQERKVDENYLVELIRENIDDSDYDYISQNPVKRTKLIHIPLRNSICLKGEDFELIKIKSIGLYLSYSVGFFSLEKSRYL